MLFVAFLTVFTIFMKTWHWHNRLLFVQDFLEYVGPVMELIDLVLLSTSIIVLYRHASRQEQFAQDVEVFRREKCQLLTTIAIFDVSFLLRTLYGIWFSIFAYGMHTGELIIAILVPACIDIIPICCILYFHTRNFKVIQFGTFDYAEDQADLYCSLEQQSNNEDENDERATKNPFRSLDDSGASSLIKLQITAVASEDR